MGAPAGQRGASYVELLVALAVIALVLTPALQALRTGFDSAAAQGRSAVLAQAAAGRLETVLAEPFASLRAAAAAQGTALTPGSYSDPAGTPDRLLVRLWYYDAANADGDGDPYTILDPNADGDGSPWTGASPRIGLLWARVEVAGTALAIETLTAD